MGSKNLIIIIVSAVLILAIGAFYFLGNSTNKNISLLTKSDKAGTQTKLGSVTIKMTKEAFQPSEITIKKGQVVVFENDDTVDRWPASNIHPTHQIYPEFDPKQPVSPGTSWSFTFDRVGIWRFHDHLNPQLGGVVTVGQN